MKKTGFILSGLFVIQVLIAQVGISTSNPTEMLDVAGGVRIRGLKPAENDNSFDRLIMSNSSGVLGYKLLSDASYQLKDMYSVEMSRVVSNSQLIASNAYITVDIGLKYVVSVKAKTSALILLDYSVPAYKVSSGQVMYIGVKLQKTQGGVTGELPEGSRKYTVGSSFYASGSDTFHGQSVLGKTIDIVDNQTQNEISITYEARGYIETNKGTVVFFGSDGSSIYNWGTGYMSIMFFDKAL